MAKLLNLAERVGKWLERINHSWGGTAVGGKASEELRAMSYQVTLKVEAGYKPPYTTENLIGYTASKPLAFLFRI